MRKRQAMTTLYEFLKAGRCGKINWPNLNGKEVLTFMGSGFKSKVY